MNKNNSILKWPGGKRKISGEILKVIEKNSKNNLIDKNKYYIEFFAGGLSSALEVATNYPDKKIIVNDINKSLIDFYINIQSNFEQLMNELKLLSENFKENINNGNGEEYYYLVRDSFNNNKESCTPKQSAYFYFLNKNCFNGLYRENKKGLFNVSYNKKDNYNFFNVEHFLNFKNNIKNIKFENLNYVDFIIKYKNLLNDSVIYLDPPYFSTFKDYSKDGFNYIYFLNEITKISNINKNIFISEINKDKKIFEIYKDFSFLEIGQAKKFSLGNHLKKNNKKQQEILFYKK